MEGRSTDSMGIAANRRIGLFLFLHAEVLEQFLHLFDMTTHFFCRGSKFLGSRRVLLRGFVELAHRAIDLPDTEDDDDVARQPVLFLLEGGARYHGG